MKRTLKVRVLVILVLWGVLGTSELLACGNKFLVASRGTRFGMAPIAREEASILVYANSSSSLSGVTGKLPVEEVLVRAGYLPITVTDPAELDLALQRGSWDLVLADLADSAELRGRLQGIDAPTVVPVLYEPTRSALAQAKKDYDRVVKAPIKSQRFLRSIDDAVALRGE